VRSLRSRSPLTRIYTQQQSSDIFMAYGEPIACSSYRTIGTVGGDNQFSPSKHERVSNLRFYIYFFRCTMRVTSDGFSRSHLSRGWIFAGFTLQFAFLSSHLLPFFSFFSTSYRAARSLFVPCFDWILERNFCCVPNEAPGSAMQCLECDGVMREF